MLESMVIIEKLWRLYYNAIFCFKIDSILYIEGVWQILSLFLI